MTLWTTRAHELRRAQAQILADILLSIDSDQLHPDETKHIASPAGSERALRGIPVVGAPGVGGTIAGTNPLSACISRDRWRHPSDPIR